MDGQAELTRRYQALYQAMMDKDTRALEELLDDAFVLIHMTGMRQPKDVFIRCVADGTLNYYSAQHEHISVQLDGDVAHLIGQSRVNAAVFGGGRSTWRLQLRMQLKQKAGRWVFTGARASTY